MFKYLKMIPLIFYPYAYMIIIIWAYIDKDIMDYDNYSMIVMIYAIVIHILSLSSMIFNLVQSCRGKYSTVEVSRINLITKCAQIPAYLINFFFGLLGLLMGVWGIIIVGFMIIVDLLTIFQTGISSIGVVKTFKKEKALDATLCNLLGFLSFIYVLDVVASIIFYLRGLSFEKKKKINENNNDIIIDIEIK